MPAQIFVDYDRESIKPVVRIDIESTDGLIWFRNRFQELTSGVISKLELEESESVEVMGMKKLTLELAPNEPFLSKAIDVVDTSQEEPTIRWHTSSDGWENSLGLLEGLGKDDRPGHNYFSYCYSDDAEIVIAFKEVEQLKRMRRLRDQQRANQSPIE